MNELIEHKSWLKRNWKWLIPVLIIIISVVVLLSTSSAGGKIAGMAKINAESSVYDDALELAKKNEQVVAVLGELQPLGKLAIIEGSHKYSNGYKTIKLSVTVTGSKSEGDIRSKMDILADKVGTEWIYKTINIRIKKPDDLKQTIEIIEPME